MAEAILISREVFERAFPYMDYDHFIRRLKDDQEVFLKMPHNDALIRAIEDQIEDEHLQTLLKEEQETEVVNDNNSHLDV